MAFKDSGPGGRHFISSLEFSVIAQAFKEFSGTTEYQLLGKLYEDINSAVELSHKLKLASLFQEQLAVLVKRKTTSVPLAVDQIVVELQRYISRLSATVEMLSGVARPAPKIMHFVWVGGSEVGAIQRDYMNIWRQVMEPEGYRFNLWYDSDALLAFEMNRVILDSARLDAMESGGKQVTRASQLAGMIEDRARVLKQQMFEHLHQPQWAGRADEARIDLLVRAYGKERATLQAFRQQCLDSHLAMVGPRLRLRDVRREFADHFLADVYQREVAMRGNFAAASDVVRLQAEHLEGGRYSDMDYLPPLVERLGGVDISGFDDVQRLGVLQLLLNHDETLMPGRERHRYPDRTENIPEPHREALLDFARRRPGVHEVFVPPQVVDAPDNGFRMGQQLGAEMNAHFLAQPDSGMTLSIMQMIRFNYDVLHQVEQTMASSGFAWSQTEELLTVIENITNEIRARANLSHWDDVYLAGLYKAIYGYYHDGIRNQAGGTIVLTGPGAALAGLREYIDAHLQPDALNAVLAQLKLTEGYNFQTEEETISGWIIKGRDDEWLAKERSKWQEGKLKSRYAGRIPDLLKQQSLTFKQGWPIIEGKPVLLTSVLQQLMDDLGEPFIAAMREKLSGDITFDKTFSVSFDTRQMILAQAVTELPVAHGADVISHLNELLTRIAHGSMPLEQLSPGVRVLLGGIFGATSLDDAGFADTWQAVRKLALDTDGGGTFARYDAVEKILRERQSPEPPSRPVDHHGAATPTARELKVLAMSEPLTVRQWQERIGQIRRVAQKEYRTQILQRSAQVREVFVAAGALSSRQLSQELLLRTASEPGRRCYPLALLMGAAVVAGESAERALVGHVATATVSPQTLSSRALLSALDELRALPAAAIGTRRGKHNLSSAMQALDANSAPGVLLLDTGDHALLLAKVQVGAQTVYRFYDPNFAIYAFANGAQATRAIDGYLGAGDSTLARLYGLGDMASAQFNVIELNTAAIAERVLSSDLRVSSFLQNLANTDTQNVSVWEKQALARTRSLSENAQMGASLAGLDARYWAGEFEQATFRLRREQKIGREYLPLLDTLKSRSEGEYSLSLVDARNPQHAVEVMTRDARFYKVRQYVDRLVQAAAGQPHQVADADGGSRLSFAFAIQTLISEMRQRDYRSGEQIPRLTVALQVQVYVSYAQLGFGVVSDVLQMASLVRQVAAGEQALHRASLSGRLAGPLATGVGVAFSVANIGFDIYNLSQAQNHEQRARFSTSLAFNVAALGLDVVALAAGGVVGAAAASLAIPLLGVGIGVTAIASNLGQIMDKAAAVGEHLSQIHDAYQASYEAKGRVLQFPPKAVITELDMQRRRVVFEGQKLYPWKGSALELPQYDDAPDNRHNAIDIRAAFARPAVAGVWGSTPEALVLPCSPVCYYGYEYQLGSAGYAPLSLTRYPQLHDRLAQQLEYDAEGKRRFYLFSTPSLPHILFTLLPVYLNTTIKVQIIDSVRQLVVPELPSAWQKKIAYHITAPQGQYQIRLAPGLLAVTFDQAKGWERVIWRVNASWARSEHVSFRDKPRDSADSAPDLLVDGITLNRFEGFIELAEGLFRIDWQDRRLHLVAITLDDEKNLEETADQASAASESPIAVPARVLRYLRNQVKTRRLTAAYLPLHKFKVPYLPADRQVFTTAYYDTARDRTLYARNVPPEVSEGLVLAGASDRHAWFYHPDHATIWRVDVNTGTVLHRYRLKNPRTAATIVECLQSTDGSLRISQRLPEEQGQGVTIVEYRVTAQTIELTGCKITFSSEDYFFKPDEALRQVDVPARDDTPGMGGAVSEWSYAPFIVVQGYTGKRLSDRAWINKTTGKRCLAGKDLSWPEDLLMLMPSDPQNNAVLFYSQQARTISRGIQPRVDYFENVVIERDVIEVTRTGGLYLATKADGRLYEVDIVDVPPAEAISEATAFQYGVELLAVRSDDNWRSRPGQPAVLGFAGVGQTWLRQHPDWLSALPVLAKAFKASPFPVIGLNGLSGDSFLAAWCVDEKVALADTGRDTVLSLLGLTPDKRAVWLLDGAAGQLYRQPLREVEALRAAFASGDRLIDPGPLAKTERVWPQWAFVQVQRQGEALIGQTREGVNVQLLDGQPAKIIGVANHWSSVYGQSPEQLRRRLQVLVSGQSHAPVLHVESAGGRYKYYVPELDRLFDLSGRSDGQWAVFLGTRGSHGPMLYDPVDQLIFSAEPIERVWLPESYAQRDEAVMALEVAGEITEISALLPDGVDKLLLSFGAQSSGYLVTQEAWQRLDCIVVEPRQASSEEDPRMNLVHLDMSDCARLLMSTVQGHLLFTDPDTACTLIIRNVESTGDEAPVALQLSCSVDRTTYSFSLRQWMEKVSLAHADGAIIDLGTVIKCFA